MQPGAETKIPHQTPTQKRGGVGKPGIGAAKTKDKIDPDPDQHNQKQQISQPPGTKGSQKTVNSPQTTAQQQRPVQAQPAVHPNSRRRRLTGLGSS